MAGRVTVQWCPRCDAWKPSETVARSILKGAEQDSQFGTVSFEYFRQTHQCNACNESFVTIRPAEVAPVFAWHANAEATKLSMMEAAVQKKLIAKAAPASWDYHPELADFSAALITG